MAKRSLMFPDRVPFEDPYVHGGPLEHEDLSQVGTTVVPSGVRKRCNHEQPGCSSSCASQHSSSSSSQVQCAQSLGLSASENESGNEMQDACLQTPVSSGENMQSAATTREKRKRSRPFASPNAQALLQTGLAARHGQPTLQDLMQASLLNSGDLIACRMYNGA